MSQLGRVQNSLVAATQETTLALASINFDFSLMKVEAPKEFRELGACLSPSRRAVAETGPQHVTARKLGALFHSVIPPVQRLVSAYGTRVSEIAKMPGINPKGSRADGPFASLVGADGTSIWAAATSGSSAIAVHLLACMLARMWSPQEATSIWAELVDERKKLLDSDEDMMIIAARHVSLTRDQLANWDASARAWLKTADEAKKHSQTQLMLIVQRFDLNVNHKMSTYNSVLEAWSTAMVTADKLISGVPQSVSEGSMLLGVASWHLYPDILALEKSNRLVKQNDRLVTQGGLLTVGLQSSSPQQDRGIYWSLPLAYFRYYGDPVTTTKSIGNHSARVPVEQLLNVALGCIFREWALRSQDYHLGSAFLSEIWRLFSTYWPVFTKFSGCGYNTTNVRELHTIHSFQWLRHIAAAADRYLEARLEERSNIEKVIAYGHRRCKCFLSRDRKSQPPFFGLTNIATWLSLLRAPTERINFLRQTAQRFVSGSELDSMVVRYLRKGHSAGEELNYGYATIRPIQQSTHPRRTPRNMTRFTHTFSEESRREDNIVLQNGEVRFYGGQILWRDAPSLFPKRGVVIKDKETLDFIMSSSNGKAADNESLLDDDFVIVYPQITYEVRPFSFVFGDLDTAALFSNDDFGDLPDISKQSVDIKSVIKALKEATVDPQALMTHMYKVLSEDRDWSSSLRALGQVVDIFKLMPGAKISLEATDKPLHDAQWFKGSEANLDTSADTCSMLSRKRTFSCITFFETGGMDIPPDNLQQVMAMSLDNSIYVAAPLLCDPIEVPHQHEVRRIIGNIGKAGIAFLIPPKSPLIRKSKPGDWRMVNHNPFSGNAEDCFQDTSLHLALTDYTIPFTMEHEGAQDTAAYFQEALVSVFDRTEWVADLDCLGNLESPLLKRSPVYKCKHAKNIECRERKNGLSLLTSIDSWHELLDRPKGAAIIRSHENWIGRLATVCLSIQRNYQTVVMPHENTCWVEYLQALRKQNDEDRARTIAVF